MNRKSLLPPVFLLLASIVCCSQTLCVFGAAPTVWDTSPRLAYGTLFYVVSSIVVILAMLVFLLRLKRKNRALTKNSENQKDELIETQRELTEVKARTERTTSVSPIVFLLTIDGIIKESNEYSRSRLGAYPGDSVHRFYANPEQRDLMIAKAGREKLLTNEIVHYKLTNGEIHRFLTNVATTEYEGAQAFIAWAVDVEDYELKTDEIITARTNMQTVLEALPIPVRLTDCETGGIIYANKSCYELFECGEGDELVGRKLIEMMPLRLRNSDDSADRINYLLSIKETKTIDIEYVSLKGKTIEASVTVTQIDYNGRLAALAIIKDLAKERREEELSRAAKVAEESTRVKSAFLANMSHEIRTPMNTIIGFSEIVLDKNPPPEIKDYILKIRKSSDVLLSIVNDILDMSKIESRKMLLESIPFNLHEVFSTCQTIVSQRAAQKGITLYCYAEPSIGKMLVGDPSKLRQVLLNLLSNAVKFTNIGVVKLLSAIEIQDEHSATIRFEVKDSGIGITKEQIEKIFDPFVQAVESTTRKFGGTGLGLSIAKSIIEMMGGKLEVESTPGVGSRFSFVLTFKTRDMTTALNEVKGSAAVKEMPMFRGEALICEDNDLNKQVICEHLSRVGISTVVAENGQVGVEKVAERIESGKSPFDIIFMDIHMPVMDGIDAANIIREIGSKTPIVALTANIMPESREAYVKSGMLGFIGKPFTPQQLWSCLMEFLTPVSFVELTDPKSAENEKLLIRLKAGFVKDNRDTFKEFSAALHAGDLNKAHIIIHSLKGTAGLVGKKRLMDCAGEIEAGILAGNAEFAEEQLDTLAIELEAVLEEFAPYTKMNEKPAREITVFDRSKALEVFDRLDGLLSSYSYDSLDMVEELRAIPDTEMLIAQIEQYDFGPAYETLSKIKAAL